MNVGIYCNRTTKKFASICESLFALLKRKKIAYTVFEDVGAIGGVDALVILGGDGTVLKAAIAAGRKGIRVLGINAGNLGFLTDFEGEQVAEAVALLTGRAEVERRSVLEVRAGGQTFYALNDAVFQRGAGGAADDNVVAVTAFIDGKKVDEFVGDGVIVSTPTGSTAYSLSAGGSILTPDIEAFILTPICAHSLHNRPIVFADSSELRVRLADSAVALDLFCDGRSALTMAGGEEAVLRKADFCVEFLKRADSNFFDRLLFKLTKWSK